jgi:Tfp pilus assembly protein PilF
MNSPSHDRAAATQPRSRFVQILAHPASLSLLLAAAVVLTFRPVTQCAFLNYDDPVYFTDNAQVQSGLTWRGFKWAFHTSLMGNWHPAVWLSYMLDVALYGHGPAGPHFTNLMLHAANGVLLFLLLNRLTGARWRSLVVAALFALHPLRVESVAWVSERKDVLSAFFGLWTLLFYARYARKQLRMNAAKPEAAGASVRDYLFALLFFVLALMSKIMLVTLPFVMLLLDYWPLQRFLTTDRSTIRRLIFEKLPFLAFGLVVGLITFFAHRNLGALTPLTLAAIPARLGNALVAGTCYLGRTFWPANLALPYPRVDHWPPDLVLLSALLLGGICVAAVWLGRKQPWIFVGWFWFVGMLLPVSGLIQWGEHSMADRFTYLPSIGFFILLTWVIAEFAKDWQLPGIIVVAGTVLALGAEAICTRRQLDFWRNSETLFRHSITVNPANYVAWCNLGVAFGNRGETDKAEGYFATALKLNPDYARALNDLGVVLLHRSQVEDAAALVQKAVQLEPHDASAWFNLGQICMAQGKPDQAVTNFQTALRLQPDSVEASKNLASVLIRLGRMDEAVACLQQVVDETPDDAEVLSNLGSALAMKGETDLAIVYFRRALRCSPDSAETHFNLANTLVLQHHIPDAIVEYQEALRLKPDYAAARQQLNALRTNAPPAVPPH